MVLGSVGRVLPSVQVQVRCPQGSECAPGVSGQLWGTRRERDGWLLE